MTGKIIDGVNGNNFINKGSWEKGLSITNDAASFIFSGGNGSAIHGIIYTQGIIRASHSYTIFSNSYTVFNYGRQK